MEERKARVLWLQERRFGGEYRIVTAPGTSYLFKPQIPAIVPEYVAHQLEAANQRAGRTKFLIEYLTPAGIPEIQGVTLVPEIKGSAARPEKTKKRPSQPTVAALLRKKAA
jgi:hypothetical protein